jgi:hypothetical protein
MVRLKALLMIMIFGSAVYVGSKVAPAYYTHYQFQNDLEQAVMTESYSTRSEAEIQESVAARGRDYGIPLKLDQIQVRRDRSALSISVEYSVHFDIPIYPFDLRFTSMKKNRQI